MQDSQPAGLGIALEPLDDRRLRVLVEHSTTLRFQVTAALAVMGAVAWDDGWNAWLVIAWLALAILVREARTVALRRLPARTDLPVARRLESAARWSLAMGIAQGAASGFMLRSSDNSSALLTMVLVSMCAGSVSAAYTVPRACQSYLLAIKLPLALVWASKATWEGIGVAVLIVMFLGVLLRIARQNLAAFEASFRMRLENRELLAQLSQERELLTQARDAAVRADRSKSRFLAAASHDLRQPLQSLSLNCSALLRQPLENEGQHIAREMSASIEALRLMLDGLLDLSQLDAGVVKPRFQPIPLAVLVENVCARLRPAAHAKGLQLICSCDPQAQVLSDIEMLRRVLSNLLDNAIKFTSSGEIRIDQSEHGPHIRLSVSDTGCGIAESDLEQAFEDLTQLGNPQRNRAFGNGLGLGIVRRLTRLLGVECRFESTLGQGTTVHLDLPAQRHAGPVVSTTAGAQPSLVGRRVLVVDDDGQVRQAYMHALTALGCHVRCVERLDDAIEVLQQDGAEVALVDYRLGQDVDGLQAIEALRARHPRLGAVLVTADTSPSLRAHAARLGVPFLRKPVTDLTLTLAIDDALNEQAPSTPPPHNN